jgi:hypothetical protein
MFIQEGMDMRFTNEQIHAAAGVDLVQYCAAVGISLVQHSGDTYRHAEYDSLKITGNLWKRYSGRTNGKKGFTKGNAIHFVQEYEGLEFQVAVLKLLEVSKSPLMPELKLSVKVKLQGYEGKPKPQPSHLQQDKVAEKEKPEVREKKPFALPPKGSDNKRVIAYLTKTRQIDHEIVNHMIKHGTLYEDAEHHNCVFVGYDPNNIPRYAALKGTYTQEGKAEFRGEVEGGRKQFGWCFTPEAESPLLRVYESPIDAMSHMSIEKAAGGNWRNKHYLSLGALAYEALPEYLKQHPEVKTVSFCLDNDIAGRQKTEEFTAKLQKQGYTCANWHNIDTMTLCSFKDLEGIERYLAANRQIKNISLQISPGEEIHADKVRKMLTEKGCKVLENNVMPNKAKDINEMLKLKKKRLDN